ncbi:hypothetical protein CEXT_603131 [Caerostris extrusa]|uniref:Secreted protein n=1 Tax=Caerostris extrusa TaxID=172846 RepID=A0AAV4SMI8_CAEEX|nr:hypothetical protein CEXT_603131 [Caerostris extrusa]
MKPHIFTGILWAISTNIITQPFGKGAAYISKLHQGNSRFSYHRTSRELRRKLIYGVYFWRKYGNTISSSCLYIELPARALQI